MIGRFIDVLEVKEPVKKLFPHNKYVPQTIRLQKKVNDEGWLLIVFGGYSNNAKSIVALDNFIAKKLIDALKEGVK